MFLFSMSTRVDRRSLISASKQNQWWNIAKFELHRRTSRWGTVNRCVKRKQNFITINVLKLCSVLPSWWLILFLICLVQAGLFHNGSKLRLINRAILVFIKLVNHGLQFVIRQFLAQLLRHALPAMWLKFKKSDDLCMIVISMKYLRTYAVFVRW